MNINRCNLCVYRMPCLVNGFSFRYNETVDGCYYKNFFDYRNFLMEKDIMEDSHHGQD